MAESLFFFFFFLFFSSAVSSSSMGINKDQNFPSPQRKLSNGFNPISHITPDNFQSPSVVTVPAANPTNPTTTPVPITVPGAQPTTNPVTNYPSPPLPGGGNGVPATTTNPTTPPPPATTNNPPPATSGGQSWCVAKSGIPQSTLQTALDYACGKGADCSQIQQGGSCSNPSTLQNYASVAFNSFYQKNPAPTSCDFGGAATIVTTNPSSGSCIYPSSASSSSSSSSSSTSSGGGILGSGTPSSGFNSTSPGSPSTFPLFGNPPGYTPPSMSSGSLSFSSCFVLVASFLIGAIALHI